MPDVPTPPAPTADDTIGTYLVNAIITYYRHACAANGAQFDEERFRERAHLLVDDTIWLATIQTAGA